MQLVDQERHSESKGKFIDVNRLKIVKEKVSTEIYYKNI